MILAYLCLISCVIALTFLACWIYEIKRADRIEARYANIEPAPSNVIILHPEERDECMRHHPTHKGGETA